MANINPYDPPEFTDNQACAVDTVRDKSQPSGLGGWLVLVGLGLVTSPLRIGALLLLTFLPLFSNGVWETLTTPGSDQYIPFLAPLLIFEILGNVGFLIAYVALTVLFFQKSRLFPKAYIAVALVNLGFVLLDAWVSSFVVLDEPMLDEDTAKELFRSVISAAIWVPYMIYSKRVRNTFV